MPGPRALPITILLASTSYPSYYQYTMYMPEFCRHQPPSQTTINAPCICQSPSNHHLADINFRAQPLLYTMYMPESFQSPLCRHQPPSQTTINAPCICQSPSNHHLASINLPPQPLSIHHAYARALPNTTLQYYTHHPIETKLTKSLIIFIMKHLLRIHSSNPLQSINCLLAELYITFVNSLPGPAMKCSKLVGQFYIIHVYYHPRKTFAGNLC